MVVFPLICTMMPKGVILDAFTMNPGDQSWRELEKQLDLTIYDRTPATSTVERCKDAEFIFTNKVVLDRAALEALPQVKYIGIMATGINVVDVDSARERGITVTNIPAYSTESVAQMVFAFIMHFTMHVGLHNDHIHNKNGWSGAEDFSYTLKPLTEISGKTLGIWGWGAIGQKTAEIGRAFGMRILVASDHASSVAGGELVSLGELFERSDFLSINKAFTEDKWGIINKDFFGKMKPTAFLINTARGMFIHDQDLADALNVGKLAGAGLDVFTKEPPAPDNPLLTAKNCVITPHIAWATVEARNRAIAILSENVSRYLQGDPINVVS